MGLPRSPLPCMLRKLPQPVLFYRNEDLVVVVNGMNNTLLCNLGILE